MKSILITLSLVANAALLLHLLSPATFQRLVPFARSAPAGSADSAVPRRSALRPPGAAESTTGFAPSRLLESDNRALLTNLRAAGVPESVIRAVLAAKLNEPANLRRRQLQAETHAGLAYWENPPPNANLSFLTSTEMRQMRREALETLNQLLGPAPVAPGLESAYERMQYGNLPSDKVALLKLINSDYSDLELPYRLGTIRLPEDQEKVQLLAAEKDKDLRAVLTPAEYEDYMFRSSPAGNTLRNQLTHFEPTEAEFRALFSLQKEFSDRFSTGMIAPNPMLLRERAAAQQKLTADFKAAIAELNPDRVADYERTTDPTFRTLSDLATRLEMPKDQVTPIWTLQRDLQARATAIRGDRSLTPEVRSERLAALQTEATGRLATAFGSPRNFEAYKQNAGQWIQNLVPPNPGAPGGTAVGPTGDILRAF